MKLTRFEKLLAAVQRLGANQAITTLIKKLELGEVTVDPENLVYGQNGIYLVDKTGLLTKVILHIVNKNIEGHYFPEEARSAIKDEDYENNILIKKIHKFHLINCTTLRQAQKEGWRDKYAISTRKDGKFFYRFTKRNSVVATNREQVLNICGNCLREINDLKFLEKKCTTSNFNLDDYFAEGFQKHWIPDDGVVKDIHSRPNVYSRDWDLISIKYRRIINFQCEGTNCERNDLSDPKLHKYLHCHHVNFDKSNNNYSNLKALCIRCHAEQATHNHLKNSPDYTNYINMHFAIAV